MSQTNRTRALCVMMLAALALVAGCAGSGCPEASLERSPVVLAPSSPAESGAETTVVVGIPE